MHTQVSVSRPPHLPSKTQLPQSIVAPSDKVKSLGPVTWDSSRNLICPARGVYLPLASAHFISAIDFVQLPKNCPICFPPPTGVLRQRETRQWQRPDRVYMCVRVHGVCVLNIQHRRSTHVDWVISCVPRAEWTTSRSHVDTETDRRVAAKLHELRSESWTFVLRTDLTTSLVNNWHISFHLFISI